ncbi:hypothetical protein D9757_001453 [Collybiopsis confluens]|uniref:Uncharacterized protein n=1 Tax=Collybiopsis confluens TaxID=2823264 RepID=A0A8H5MFN5_9AGAR|nr:hypothetical protein D9757_001453 [Collybiopsis confluens]
MSQRQLLPIIVAQYHLDGHYKGPKYKHWSIVVLVSRTKAYIYEVQGAINTFTYAPTLITDFEQSVNLQGGYLVGHISPAKLGWLSEQLADVEVKKYDGEWDCQSWVMDALRVLKDSGVGIITSDIGRGHIISELREELERWDLGEDIVHERLFPESK